MISKKEIKEKAEEMQKELESRGLTHNDKLQKLHAFWRNGGACKMYNDTILYNQSYTRGGPVKCNRQPRRVQVTISKTPSIILSFADSMAQSHLQGGL